MLIRLLVIAGVGFMTQLIDGTLGMGYGVTSATLLISLGVYPAIASASVHTAEVVVSLASGVSHFKLGNVRKDIFFPLTICGVLGGVLGAYGLVNLPVRPVKLVVSSILLAMGTIILYRFWLLRSKPVLERDGNSSFRRLALLGFCAAFIDAMGGGGWGPICTPSLIIAGNNPQEVVGSVNLAEFFITLAMTITFIVLIGPENFLWDVVIALLIAGLAAAPVAALLCKRLPHRILGILVGLAVVVLSARMLLTAW